MTVEKEKLTTIHKAAYNITYATLQDRMTRPNSRATTNQAGQVFPNAGNKTLF